MLRKQLCPLPPLEEQKRIVEKYNELLPLITKYEKVYTSATKLQNDFPIQLRRSILQWAVQGKLVPQDPSDEPAEKLLERIREEKQRLVKEGKSKRISTNPLFLDGIIPIMRSWMVWSGVSMMNCRLKSLIVGYG